MANIQVIQFNNQQVSSHRRIIVPCKKIWVKEANTDVRIITEADIAVSAHAQKFQKIWLKIAINAAN